MRLKMYYVLDMAFWKLLGGLFFGGIVYLVTSQLGIGMKMDSKIVCFVITPIFLSIISTFFGMYQSFDDWKKEKNS